MSAILITITSDSTTIKDLPAPPARPRPQTKLTCPVCGGSNLRHRLYSTWHECKSCHKSFQAHCSRHKHGGSLS